SRFTRWIIACPAKWCADITVTFLPGNSPTSSFSMPTHHVRRNGFIRARSITCADASLFCSGKVEDPTHMKTTRFFVAILLAGALSSLAADELAERLQPALEAITPDGLLAHIKVLASDEFEGRAPGSKGEDFSAKYITAQFKKIGFKPGKPDRKYTQEGPLAGIKSEPQMSFTVGDKTMDLKYADDFVASSARLQSEIKIEKSNLVFVGYGGCW